MPLRVAAAGVSSYGAWTPWPRARKDRQRDGSREREIGGFLVPGVVRLQNDRMPSLGARFDVRVSSVLLAALDRLAAESGLTRSEAVRALIDAGAPADGLPAPPPTAGELRELEFERLRELSRG